MSIFKCGLRFRVAVFGFCRNLYAARGLSNPFGLRFFAFFMSGSRFLDAVFGFPLFQKCVVRFLERQRYKTIAFYGLRFSEPL